MQFGLMYEIQVPEPHYDGIEQERYKQVMAQVELQAGPFRITSVMTRESAEELGLEPAAIAEAVGYPIVIRPSVGS